MNIGFIIETDHGKAIVSIAYPLCCIITMGLCCSTSNLLIRVRYLTSARWDCPSDQTFMTFSIMVDNGLLFMYLFVCHVSLIYKPMMIQKKIILSWLANLLEYTFVVCWKSVIMPKDISFHWPYSMDVDEAIHQHGMLFQCTYLAQLPFRMTSSVSDWSSLLWSCSYLYCCFKDA